MSNKWTVLMVGEDHGILGKYMSAFDGHPDCYSRVNVISEQSSGVASQYHHRLREALGRLVRSCDNLEYEAGRVALSASDAEDLLAELDNLERSYE